MALYDEDHLDHVQHAGAAVSSLRLPVKHAVRIEVVAADSTHRRLLLVPQLGDSKYKVACGVRPRAGRVDGTLCVRWVCIADENCLHLPDLVCVGSFLTTSHYP